jgi:hypothetical protein
MMDSNRKGKVELEQRIRRIRVKEERRKSGSING